MDNIVKKVCKEIEKISINISQNYNKIDNYEMLDTFIKNLIEVRNTIDFISKTQHTPTNWNEVLKGIK